MPTFHYRIVDVFTAAPLEGNALAVFSDASPIDGKMMQDIAREMNLAETAFILPAEDPTCAARVRIFTPSKEMVFAGHPTVGTSFVLFDEGRLPQHCDSFVLQEKVGPVQVWIEKGSRPMIWLKTPAIREGKRFDRTLCARALGLSTGDLLDLPPQLLDAGNPTLLVGLRNEDAVDRAWLDMQGMRGIKDGEAEPFCVFVFCRSKEGAYSRMFAPEYSVVEDPATGSSTGPLAAYMMKHGLIGGAGGMRFVSEQGAKMKRRSLLHVRLEGRNGSDGIYVGGHVTPIAECTMRI